MAQRLTECFSKRQHAFSWPLYNLSNLSRNGLIKMGTFVVHILSLIDAMRFEYFISFPSFAILRYLPSAQYRIYYLMILWRNFFMSSNCGPLIEPETSRPMMTSLLIRLQSTEICNVKFRQIFQIQIRWFLAIIKRGPSQSWEELKNLSGRCVHFKSSESKNRIK